MARNLFSYLMVIFMAFAMTACGDNTSDDDYNKPQWNDNQSSLTIDEHSLIGTWYQERTSSYGNENYISFDGNGNGQMVLIADYFTHIGSEGYSDSSGTMGRLIHFSYSIIDNEIKILPTASSVSPFTITVLEQTKKGINLRFPSTFIIGYHNFEKFNSNPNWFSEYGPASIDLTKNLTGKYQADQDELHTFTVTKVNDYTITIVDESKGSTTTGQLYWYQLYNGNKTGYEKASLNSLSDPSYGLSPFYSFGKDGKLYVGAYGSDFSASKVK